jgi:hypothetical protein
MKTRWLLTIPILVSPSGRVLTKLATVPMRVRGAVVSVIHNLL